MASRPQKPKDPTIKADTPKGMQYLALKGMSYSPSTRNDNRKARKQVKQQLRREEW